MNPTLQVSRPNALPTHLPAPRKLAVMDDYAPLARMIDHAVLKPNQTLGDLEQGCRMSRAYGIASCCVMPHYAGLAADLLNGSETVACSVIGFPHGSGNTAGKVAEARFAAGEGARELDFVVNVSRVKSGDWDYVTDDCRAVIDEGHECGVLVKAIFECCYLTDDEKRRLCEITAEAQVDWVKTSTGFGTPAQGVAVGATDADLRLMKAAVPDRVQVKASGGIRTLARLREVAAIGCTRAGTSSTTEILDELRSELGLDPITVSAGASGVDGY